MPVVVAQGTEPAAAAPRLAQTDGQLAQRHRLHELDLGGRALEFRELQPVSVGFEPLETPALP